MSNKVYNFQYKGLARDVIFELSKSHDPDIIDKFTKELRRLSKHEDYMDIMWNPNKDEKMTINLSFIAL